MRYGMALTVSTSKCLRSVGLSAILWSCVGVSKTPCRAPGQHGHFPQRSPNRARQVPTPVIPGSAL